MEDDQALRGDAFRIFFISLKEDQVRSVEKGLIAGAIEVLKQKTAKTAGRNIEFSTNSFFVFILVPRTRYLKFVEKGSCPPQKPPAYGTCLYLAEPVTQETFLRDYRQILMDNFQKMRIEGGSG